MKLTPCLLPLIALAACAGAPEPADAAPAPMPAAGTIEKDNFEERLQRELQKFTPAPTRETERGADAIGQLRQAQQRERELRAELRRSCDRDGTLPVALVRELREVRDDLYDGLWRILVDGSTEALPADLLALGGGVR